MVLKHHYLRLKFFKCIRGKLITEHTYEHNLYHCFCARFAGYKKWTFEQLAVDKSDAGGIKVCLLYVMYIVTNDVNCWVYHTTICYFFYSPPIYVIELPSTLCQRFKKHSSCNFVYGVQLFLPISSEYAMQCV